MEKNEFIWNWVKEAVFNGYVIVSRIFLIYFKKAPCYETAFNKMRATEWNFGEWIIFSFKKLEKHLRWCDFLRKKNKRKILIKLLLSCSNTSEVRVV